MPKIKEKKRAINLRKQGFSYSEILEETPVAKSTLSLWLRSVGLSKKQKQRLTEKKLAAMKRGWEAVHTKRLLLVEGIKKKAKKEIGKINKRELWLIGTALYWAEGHKEKEYKAGQRVMFDNSDPRMILLFARWLEEICQIPQDNLIYDLYIHETADWRIARRYWAKALSISTDRFRVYFKKNKIKTKRKNKGENYRGLIRITVIRSTNFNRKINGWIEGICEHCRVV